MTRIDDYELIGKLGEGGMGAVYKARQISLDRIVALKVLAPKLAKNPEFVTRFLREARATAKLNHPNIVAGIGVGSAGGYHYFAMEFVEGESFKRRVEAKARMSEAEVLRIGAAVASALAHAHTMGIVHRDVKPDNILIARDGTPKLADLGLAKGQNHEDNSLTQTGMAVGTPHYIAPEQASGEQQIDGRADTYALGCTLYHAATGATPFQANTSAAVMVKHINERMPHPQSLRPELSDALCLILSRMVARERNDRYATIADAAADMEAVLAGEQPGCRPLPPAKYRFIQEPTRTQGMPPRRERTETRRHAPVEGPAGADGRESRRRIAPQKKSPPWLVPAAAGGAVVLCVAGYFLSGSGKPPEKTLAGISEPAKTAVTVPSLPTPVAPRPDSPPPLPSLPRPVAVAHAETPPPEPAKPPQKIMPADSPAKIAAAPTPTAAIGSEGENLFDGATLAGWDPGASTWSVQNGAVVGRGISTTNASIWKYRCLPPDFELSFNADAPAGFHFGYSLNEASIFIQHYDGHVCITRYTGANTTLARPLALAFGTHAWRVLARNGTLQVLIDGKPLFHLASVERKAAGTKSDLSFFAPPNNSLRLTDVKVRDLSAAGAPAAPVAVPAPEKLADAAELKQQAEAQAAYAGFADGYLSLLRKFDEKGATELLEHTEKSPAFARIAPQIKQDRALIGLLSKLLAAEAEGARKLIDIDDFELGMGRGQPQHIGKKAALHLTQVEKGVLVLDGGGVTLQTPLAHLNAETRMKLMSLGLLADAAPERAFLALLALKTPPDPKGIAAVRVLLDAARNGPPRPELDCLERWLQLVDEGAQNAAAAATWPKLQTLAQQQQWTALQQALADFTKAYETTHFFESRRAEIETLKRLSHDGLEAALPPDEILKHLTEKLKAANPEFDGQLVPVIENGKIVELQLGSRGLKDLAPLRSVPGLRKLGLIAANGGEKSILSDLSPLKGLPLTQLDVSYSDVSDLTPLAGMRLTALNISATQVASLAPLKGMPLETLSVACTGVTDYSPLSGAPLRTLECFGCAKAPDLSTLDGLPLETLNCSYNSITDVSPLRRLPLKHLTIDHIQTADLSPLKDLKLQFLRLSFKPGVHEALIRDLTTLESINGIPASEFRNRAANGTAPE